MRASIMALILLSATARPGQSADTYYSDLLAHAARPEPVAAEVPPPEALPRRAGPHQSVYLPDLPGRAGVPRRAYEPVLVLRAHASRPGAADAPMLLLARAARPLPAWTGSLPLLAHSGR